MSNPINTNSPENHTCLVQWRQRLERKYSLQELKGLCWRLNVDPEILRHETKTDLSIELVGYLDRRGRLADLEAEDKKYRESRRDTLAAYRHRLLEETQFVELTGIPLPPGRDGRIYHPRVPLDKVYIQLQAVAEEDKQREEGTEKESLEARANEAVARKAAGSGPLDFMAGLRTLGKYLYRQGQVYRAAERPQPVNPQQILTERERLVILGPPGSGKSTLLRFLARRAAEDEQSPIPILVSLRDFANAYTQNRSLTLLDFALARAAAGSDRLRLALEAAVEQGRGLWLLDALDETRLLADEIARQSTRLPGLLVLTSRPVGYSGGTLRSLPHYEVLPLTPKKVDQFLYDWIGIFVEEKGEPNEVAQQVAQLQSQLNDRPQLKALTYNPLLLTFMITLSSKSGNSDLPQQRSQLYARFIEEMRDWEILRQKQVKGKPDFLFQLGSLQQEKAKQAAVDGLNYLGWALHLNYYGGRGEEAPKPTALTKQLADYLAQDGYSDTESLAIAILDFWQTAGMLDMWQLEHHTYLAFRHLTFQEYAAAWGLQRAWAQHQAATWRFLRPRLHHPSWREPILLWSSLIPVADISRLVGRLRRGVSQNEHILHRDLRLATAILGEGISVSGKLVQQIVGRLAWLGRSHKRQQILILAATYVSGLAALFIFLPFTIAVAAGIFWSIAWSGCFLYPVFPRLRPILELPLQLQGLATTPFIPAYSSMAIIRRSPLLTASLIAALQDENKSVRKEAASALGQIGDKAAVPHLITTLQNDSENVRAAAAWALGQIGDATAIPHLITASKGIR